MQRLRRLAITSALGLGVLAATATTAGASAPSSSTVHPTGTVQPAAVTGQVCFGVGWSKHPTWDFAIIKNCSATPRYMVTVDGAALATCTAGYGTFEVDRSTTETGYMRNGMNCTGHVGESYGVQSTSGLIVYVRN